MTRPTKEDRKKYDIDFAGDLNFGLGMEDEVIAMFKDKKIEVKSEKGMWQRTGNIAVEYESWGNHQVSMLQSLTIGFTICALMVTYTLHLYLKQKRCEK